MGNYGKMRVNVLEMEHIVNHKKKIIIMYADLLWTLHGQWENDSMGIPRSGEAWRDKKRRRDSSYTKSDASPLKKIC